MTIKTKRPGEDCHPAAEPVIKTHGDEKMNVGTNSTHNTELPAPLDARALNAIDACRFSVEALLTLLEAVDDHVSDITFANHDERGQKVITDSQNMAVIAVRFAKSIIADIEAARGEPDR